MKFMSVTRVVKREMKEERMNGRDVLYYLGWNYGWGDGYVKVGHISKNYYEAIVMCEYGTLDSIMLAHITTRDVLDYLKETGLTYTATLKDEIVTVIKIIVPIEDGIWEGYESYGEELMRLEEEEMGIDELPSKVTEVNGYLIEDIDFEAIKNNK